MLNFNDNPGKIFAAHELAAVVDSAMATKMTVQFNLFGMSGHNYVSLLWGDRVAWDGLSVCGGWWSPQPPTLPKTHREPVPDYKINVIGLLIIFQYQPISLRYS